MNDNEIKISIKDIPEIIERIEKVEKETKNLQQELQRKDNIINELKKWLNENNLYKTNDNILAKLKELENDNK